MFTSLERRDVEQAEFNNSINFLSKCQHNSNIKLFQDLFTEGIYKLLRVIRPKRLIIKTTDMNAVTTS
jgi:hypothetical protein